MLWGKIEESEKGQQPPGVEPRTLLAWAASALPLSYGNRTTTSPHNPLYILHRWYWMPQSHTWQPLSMCRQNSVRGWPENSLHQERTHAEWLSHSKMLRASCLMLEIREFRCIHLNSLISSMRCPGFDYRQLLFFFTSLNFASYKFLYFQLKQDSFISNWSKIPGFDSFTFLYFTS